MSDATRRPRVLWLFIAMALCCVGMFIFYPYFVTEITGYSGISTQDISVVMLSALFLGNIMAFLFTNFKASESPSRDFIFTIAFLALSMLLLLFSPYAKSASVLLVLGGLTIYRAGIGSYFSISRIVGLDCWSDERPREKLFAWFKMVNSSSSAAGAYFGSLIIKYWGFGIAMVVSCGFFLVAILVIFLNSEKNPCPDTGNNNQINNRPSLRISSASFWFSLAGASHFVFEAQIYTLMVLYIKKNFESYTDVIRDLFMLNSVLLIVFSVPLLNLVAKSKSKMVPYFVGTGCSALAVIVFPLAGMDIRVIFILTMIFTAGEIVAPQLLIAEVTDVAKGDLRSGISVYNIATKAVGMSVGSYLGIYLSDSNSLAMTVSVWVLFLLLSAGSFFYGIRARSLQTCQKTS